MFELKVSNMRHGIVKMLAEEMVDLSGTNEFATGMVKHPLDQDGVVLFESNETDPRKRVEEACSSLLRGIEELGVEMVPVPTKARASLRSV
mgnify:CR=1 FL=1